jgi:environmental stress-induced protein Ves
MTTARHLSASQRPSRRWRSGGGITQDVALFPPIPTMGDDDFFWRASIAQVSQPSDFSPWPNVTRHFMLLSGAIRLTIDGETHLITDDMPDFIFAGDTPVYAEPLRPCRVLNLMARHGRAELVLQRQSTAFTAIADHLLMVAPQACTIDLTGHRHHLESEDAIFVETPNAAQLIQPSGALMSAQITLL